MMPLRFLRALRPRPGLCLVLGVMLLGAASSLLVRHAVTVRTMRDVAVPLMAEIPDLERRRTFLAQQMEMAELHSALKMGSLEEQVHVFILPRVSDLDRTLTALNLLQEELEAAGILNQASSIEIGPPEAAAPGITRQQIRLAFAASDDGLRASMLFLRLAGLLTIGDTLAPEEIVQLLSVTEAENPAALVALEQFLSTDLMVYARDTRAYDEQLGRAFSNTALHEMLQSALRSSLLGDVRRLFEGPFGRALADQGLWPLQFLALDEMDIERGSADGWYRVALTLSLHGRSEESADLPASSTGRVVLLDPLPLE